MGPADGDVGTTAGLAQRLRAALLREEPRAVEALLTGGADPNLVLEDGAAPLHLAARARSRRGLCCLGALLRRGGDPNTRSSESLTPLHVAAAWGCPRGLELLLRYGGDPGLRDQDGLRALDLAKQQGHVDCADILRGLRLPGLPATASPGTRNVLGPPQMTQNSSPPQAPRDCGDMGLGTSHEAASPANALEAAEEDGDSESPWGAWDSSSDEASFVTAVGGVSGAEDMALEGRSTVRARSPRQVEHGLTQAARGSRGGPGPSCESELSTQLWAMTLSPPPATFFPPLLDTGTARSRAPEPGFHALADEQASCGGELATAWLTEGEASATADGDHVPTCELPPVPATPGLQLLRRFPPLGGSRCPTLPFPRPLRVPRRPEEAQEAPSPDFSKYSPELAEALRTGCIPDCRVDEDALAQQFERPCPSKRWREGATKSSFTYLLLDPRETQDLPAQALSLTPAQCLQTFVRAIFYVGKGTRSRPDVHLWEALGYRRRPERPAPPKVRRILDIWDSGRGVVSLHCFQHVAAMEAYTREACLVEALGVQTLTNQKHGHCYGEAGSWPAARRRRLGVHLLHRALLIFLAEGQRELRPEHIQARG